MTGVAQLQQGGERAAAAVTQLLPTTLPQYDRQTLYSRMSELARTEASRDAFLLHLLQYALSVTNALGGVYFIATAGAGKRLVLGPRLFSRPLLTKRPQVQQQLAARAQEVVSQNQVTIAQEGQTTDIFVPIDTGGRPEVLALTVACNAAASEPHAVLLQSMAGFVELWQAHRRTALNQRQFDDTAALVELLSLLQNETTSQGVYCALVNQIAEYCQAGSVALGVRQKIDGRFRLMAVSRLSEIDGRSDRAKALESAFSALATRTDVVEWPQSITPSPGSTSDTSDVSVSESHQRVLDTHANAYLLGVPLSDASDNTSHVLILQWQSAPPESLRQQQLFDAWSRPLGICLSRLRQSGIKRATLGRTAITPLKCAVVLISAILVALLFLPVKHRISAQVVMAPALTRHVAANFDAVVDQVSVEPGDTIKASDVLVELKGEQLHWQLESLRAEHAHAVKQHDIALAEGRSADAQLATLEVTRIDNQIKLALDDISKLELVAPIDGVVISKAIDQLPGSPVKRGQSLIEIAPLESMVAQLHIDAEDIAYVGDDAEAKMVLDAYPDDGKQVRLNQVHPRSEVFDGRNVFVAEIPLANPNVAMRPGMRGNAKIDGDTRPLGWVLFHKPIERLKLWFGWWG